MAVCKFCNGEMRDDSVTTCTGNTAELNRIGDRTYEPVPYHPDYGDEDHRCHDCNIKRGGLHHPGCDMERCPKCGGQIISCDCFRDEEEEDE